VPPSIILGGLSEGEKKRVKKIEKRAFFGAREARTVVSSVLREQVGGLPKGKRENDRPFVKGGGKGGGQEVVGWNSGGDRGLVVSTYEQRRGRGRLSAKGGGGETLGEKGRAIETSFPNVERKR